MHWEAFQTENPCLENNRTKVKALTGRAVRFVAVLCALRPVSCGFPGVFAGLQPLDRNTGKTHIFNNDERLQCVTPRRRFRNRNISQHFPVFFAPMPGANQGCRLPLRICRMVCWPFMRPD
jgi:hypothetical protein